MGQFTGQGLHLNLDQTQNSSEIKHPQYGLYDLGRVLFAPL